MDAEVVGVVDAEQLVVVVDAVVVAADVEVVVVEVVDVEVVAAAVVVKNDDHRLTSTNCQFNLPLSRVNVCIYECR